MWFSPHLIDEWLIDKSWSQKVALRQRSCFFNNRGWWGLSKFQFWIVWDGRDPLHGKREPFSLFSGFFQNDQLAIKGIEP